MLSFICSNEMSNQRQRNKSPFLLRRGIAYRVMQQVQMPWYDFLFLREKHDQLWQALRLNLQSEGLSSLPMNLSDLGDIDKILFSPNLLFSQTCGYDIAVGRPLKLIVTPSYNAPGCGHATYSSWIVVRNQSPINSLADIHNTRFVANDERSWSGFHCMRKHFSHFSKIAFSGGHCKSLETLQSGRADVAAIDSIVWEILHRHQPELLKSFRILGQTVEATAPPLVTSRLTSDSALLALRNSFKKLLLNEDTKKVCEALLINDFVVLDTYAYVNMAERPPRLFGEGLFGEYRHDEKFAVQA